MKQLYIFISALFLLSTTVSAQKNIEFYTFEESVETYTSVAVTGNTLIPADWDDGATPVTNIGFDFVSGGIVYTQFSVNTNGTVALGATTTSSSSNNLASTSVVNQIAPLWDDLLFRASTPEKGIFYQLTGDAGSQTLIIEFQNVGRYMNSEEGTSTGAVSFQVQLFEANNTVAIVYGDMSGASDWSVHFSGSIGINAAVEGSTQFMSVTPNVDGATVSTTESNNTVTKEQILQIVTGKTYTFTPPVVSEDVDIELFAITAPNSNFLTDAETVSITLKNLGIEITEGLTLKYDVEEVETGLAVGSTVSEAYANYPITVQSSIDFSFAQTVDLVENKEYEITVTLEVADDVNLENNQMVKVVKGVVLGDLLFDQSQFITQTGVGANGADVSAVQTNLGFTDYGVNGDWEMGFTNADNFTVPHGETWYVKGFTVYSWQTGSTTESTMNFLDFKVWDKSPDHADAQLLYDFSDQNMLSGSRWSGIYRVANSSLTNAERPIMYSASVLSEQQTMVFTAGTYWIGWSGLGSMINQGIYIPPITIVGETTTGDAWHLGYAGWVPWTDDGTGTVQGMPFGLHGSKTTVGINDIGSGIRMYPNPVSDFLTIEIEKSSLVSIYDVAGMKVKEQAADGIQQINVANLKAGLYIVKIIFGNREYMHKLIKH
ncbi:MAG: T9SS type A sorting domain-containing protein [Salinivirgaceae bacterium]|nr:T9SS type A sorting domain-containing protein [Salinivirgaceae bacterium]